MRPAAAEPRHPELRQEGGTRPARAGPAARGAARQTRRDTRTETMPSHQEEKDSREHAEHGNANNSAGLKHLKDVVLALSPTGK
jgi:hypothetical protein